MRTTYNATAEEAARLNRGEQTMIVTVVKPQPVHEAIIINCAECNEPHADTGEWFEKAHKTHLCLKCGHLFRPKDTPTTGIIAPYSPGQEIAVRETIVCNALGGAIYKAGGKVTMGRVLEDNEYIHIDDIRQSRDRGYIPSIMMPRSACRTRLIAGDSLCVRAEEVLEEHIRCIVNSKQLSQTHLRLRWQAFINTKFTPATYDQNEWIFLTEVKL